MLCGDALRSGEDSRILANQIGKSPPQSWISNETWVGSLLQGGTRNFHGFDQNPTKVIVIVIVEMACFEVLNLNFERIQNAS